MTPFESFLVALGRLQGAVASAGGEAATGEVRLGSVVYDVPRSCLPALHDLMASIAPAADSGE